MTTGLSNDIPEISVVIPVYNEASHLASSLNVIVEHVKALKRPYELVLTDDGSTDETWSIIARKSREIPTLKGIRLSRNFGKEAAIRAGLSRANGKAVIVMDSDLQHPPSLIPEMVKSWTEGCDVVDAVKENRGREKKAYSVSARILTTLLNRFSGFDLRGASDFKLLDRHVVDAFLALPESLIFYRGMTEWLGFKHYRIPMQVQERVEGTSQWPFFRLVRLAITALTSFTSLPLHFVTLLGGLLLLVALTMATIVFIQWTYGVALSGFPTVILLQLLIGGSVMVSLGIIGEYLAQIYYEVKRRPYFVVAEELTAQESGLNSIEVGKDEP